MDKEIKALKADWKMIKTLAVYDLFTDLYQYKGANFEHLDIIESLSLAECFDHCEHLYLTNNGQDFFLCKANDTLLITELAGQEKENRALFELQTKDFLKNISS